MISLDQIWSTAGLQEKLDRWSGVVAVAGRGSGIGKVSMYARGGHWVAALHYYDEKGTRRHLTHVLTYEDGTPIEAGKSGNKNKRAASDAAKAWATNVAPGRTGSRETVPEYVRRDFNSRRNIADSTISSYEDSTRLIAMGLDGVEMRDLTAKLVKDWVVSLAKTYSPVTVRKSFNLLDMTCEHAVESGDIAGNPCTRTIRRDYLPKVKASEPNALDMDGVRQLNAHLDELGPTPLAVGARLALQLGLRAEEVCGLRWRDVDLDGGTLRVRQVVAHRRGEGIRTATYIKEPKSKASRRTLPRLSKDLIEMLRARRAEMREQWMGLTTNQDGRATARRPQFNDLYVVGKPDGSYMDPHWLSKQWATYSKGRQAKEGQGKEGGGWDRRPEVGISGKPVTFHGLRHTAATQLIRSGVDARTVASILGHADPSLTMRVYAEADPDAVRDGMGRAAEILGERPRAAEVLQMERRTGTE